MNLDQPDQFGGVDQADALNDVECAAEQWRAAAAHAPRPLDLDGIDAVVVTGMGGSGIAGDIVAALAARSFALPVVPSKGYTLPGFTSARTLVIAFSHSGRTEETLAAFADARRRGARRFAVTGGGALQEQAVDPGDVVVVVPRGSCPPRHSLGSLLVPALVALGLDEGLDEATDLLAAIAAEQGRTVPTAQNPAKQLALRLAESGAVALAWGARGLGAVAAYRLKCQLNENAKMPALHAELPEADHNDIVGWEQPSRLSGAAALIALRDPAGEHPQVARRFDVTTGVLADQLAFAAAITARGTTPLARFASLVMQADLLSLYTAIALDRDPTPIASIDRLKASLGAEAVR